MWIPINESIQQNKNFKKWLCEGSNPGLLLRSHPKWIIIHAEFIGGSKGALGMPPLGPISFIFM